MPVERAEEHPSFELGGNAITSFAAPSRGADECVLYRADIPAGGGLPPHRHDHQDVFLLAEGSGTVFIDGQAHELAAGDSVVIPIGALHHVEAGPGGCVMMVTMLAGTLFIPEGEGEAAVPPWGI